MCVCFSSALKNMKVFTSPRLKGHQSIEIIRVFSSCLSYLNFHQHYCLNALEVYIKIQVDADLKKKKRAVLYILYPFMKYTCESGIFPIYLSILTDQTT